MCVWVSLMIEVKCARDEMPQHWLMQGLRRVIKFSLTRGSVVT